MPIAGARYPHFGWCAHIFVLAVLAPAALTARAAAPTEPKGVLILYDENKDFAGLALLDQSFRAALNTAMPARPDVYTEYMDVSRFRDAGHEVRLTEYFRQKYADKRIDVVVAVMGPSLKFALAHGEGFFTGTPVVFCGIDQRELTPSTLPSNVTGVLVKREFKPTLELALRLQPNTRNVVFVAGTSPFNEYWREQARRELAEFEGRVKITYLAGLPMEDIQAAVARLPPDSVILYLHLFRDGAGKTFDPNAALRLIAQKANAPIYVFVDQFVGSGAVGGFVYSIEAQGAKAAEFTARVLNGEKPADIPVFEAGTNVHMFDARQLARWKIDKRALPANAVVRFHEPSFWELYRWHVVAAAAVIAAQAALIAGLLFQRRRRRLAELQRREQIEALRESEARFRSMADTAPVLIWMSGTDQGGTFFNQPWLDFTGRTLEQELGEGWTEGIHPDDRAQCLRTCAGAFDTRRAFSMEFRLRHAGGDYRWVIDHGVPRHDASGTFLGYIGTCIDVTERNLAQAEAQQKRVELAHVSRVAALGELTAALAHELRQPLTAIGNNAEAGRQFLGAVQPDLKEVRDALADIASDTQRAADVIGRLRGMLVRAEPVVAPVDLNAVVRAVEQLVKSEATFHRVPVRLELAPDLPPTMGDEVQLQQVILNLMVNAFAALDGTQPGARRLLLRTRAIDGTHLQADVQDNGVGVPAEALERIFTPFVTTKPGGLGMGLSICRSIIERHGGRLWAANNADGGTTMSLTLPVATSADAGRASALEEPSALPNAAGLHGADDKSIPTALTRSPPT